jgi:4-amino-4-deoxy-L-arabinose transferase-like glycosyltransferase
MSGRILPAPAPDDLRPGVDGTMNAPAFTWPARAGLLFVIVFFCAPLFIGLRGWDLRNDEAIYSYSVDRVLETGEWLTPRISPHDGLFLEKPPLKIWLVAGAMRLGLTPTDERGMRVLDVLFACVAFVYVYLLGWRLAGVVAGVVSAFLMFGFDSLIFEHGVRGNNMEAGVVLAYCGGMYHFVRWVDGASVRSRRLHALAAGAYFAFGFMTKFVAVLFLPLVWAVAFSMAPLAWTLARERWRDWLAPAALVVLVCSPWFVYETFVHGRTFWHEIVGLHVYARFAGTLVADHLRPWDFYLTQTWVELGFSRMRLVVLAGLALLVWHAWRRDWLARLYLIWWILPLTLVSLGTSKLYHYAFPFVPALALGGGLAAAMLFNVVDGPVGRSLAGRLAEMVRAPDARRLARRRNVLAAVGVGALALAVATAWFGPVTLEAFGVRLFRNSSPARAATVGILAWLMSGYGARTLKPVAVAVVAVLLPVSSYVLRV